MELGYEMQKQLLLSDYEVWVVSISMWSDWSHLCLIKHGVGDRKSTKFECGIIFAKGFLEEVVSYEDR